MNQEEILKYQKAAAEGMLPDAENPLFLFSTVSAELLIRFLSNAFSFEEMARLEMANRGLGMKGEWIGFDAAKRLWSLPQPGLRRHRKGLKR